jgi:hypothetical protein
MFVVSFQAVHVAVNAVKQISCRAAQQRYRVYYCFVCSVDVFCLSWLLHL